MEPHKRLLLANRAWAKEKSELRPGFFRMLSEGQRPNFLWIGCSDSRVPAEEITGTQAGELFVHRNIANLFVPSDLNLLSVLQFAVESLKVKDIIVCGHYQCGGVSAALSGQDLGLLNTWLFYIKETYSKHYEELAALSDTEKWNKLVELNVHEQVKNLANTSLIQSTWKKQNYPLIHGWVFGLEDGLLKELTQAGPGSPLNPVFEFKKSN